LAARALGLTLLHCDKVCVFTQVAHIAAAPITFALWALIVSGDNGLNGLSENNAAADFALQSSYQRIDAIAMRGAGSWGFPDGCRLIER
jgi:hypothetical protein